MAKANILGLALTAKQWGLRQGGDTPWERTTIGLVADALNQALREAATIVQDELGSREGGASPSLRGSALMAIIVRAIYDKWVDVAEQHKKHGAAEPRVRERAAVALRNFFAKTVDQQEGVSMRGLLRNLEEAKGGGANDRDLLKRLEWTNKYWSKDVLSMRSKGEYVYAGETPQDIAKVQMVYVPRATKASYEGEYTFSRDGEDLKTGGPSREFKRMGGGDTRIWMNADGKITWD